VEAWSQGRVGVDPEGASNARRGSASSNRVTPACLVRTPWMRKPLKSGPGEETSWPTWNPVDDNGTRGRGRREADPATREGKPLQAETQGRYRHERRPERLRAEQSVKRLRKPEGAAQPEEASPVLVAARF
jgi:hypothetical protein